ncbi:MAG: SusD/RagB family nutrient-binding outer membrane lipoprotein [Prevotella sp.]|nr:SusD/RagB family nutrient-binding outer membrane lipoprotein [Prevotella sp.]
MNKFLKYILMGTVVLSTASCENLENMNTDPNRASEVPSNMLMEGAEKWTMDNIYDVWFSARQCLAYSQQWSQRNYTEEDRYQIRESVNNNYFNYLYQGMANFDKVIKVNQDAATAATNSAYGANKNQIAAAMIMKVWLMDVITDTWGNVPYSDIAQLEDSAVLYCRYDDQKDIYAGMISDLTEAVNMIDVNETAFTSGDIIYGGDASKWKKFGNSLKCRLAIHLSKVDSNWKTYIKEALASGVMTSNDDAAKFTYVASGTDYAKFYEGFFVDKRNDFSINKTLCDLMKGQRDTLNDKSHPWEGVVDPRLQIYTTTNDSTYNGMCVATSTGVQAKIFKQDDVPNWYYNPPLCLSKTYAVPLMTYAEQKFIECEYNGYDAADYEAGVRASLDYWYGLAGVSLAQSDADAYVASVTKTVDAETCAIQKYIDLFTNGTEAWTEIRRTGYPNQIVRPGEYCGVLGTTKYAFSPLSDTKGDIIERVKYPTNESTLNGTNWAAAVAKLTDGTNNYYSRMYWDARTSTYEHPSNK